MLRNMSPTVVLKLCRTSRTLLAVGGLLSGCAYGQMTQVLRAQVASETDCSTLVVKPTTPYAANYQPNQYTVRGCNVDRVYTCKGEAGLVEYGDADCKVTAGTGGGAAPAAATPPADAESSGGEDDLS
ncbi:MAG: hypothetical protein RL701_646 [Pseudomonadota bacterium]|jgi:hypothetical protein